MFLFVCLLVFKFIIITISLSLLGRQIIFQPIPLFRCSCYWNALQNSASFTIPSLSIYLPPSSQSSNAGSYVLPLKFGSYLRFSFILFPPYSLLFFMSNLIYSYILTYHQTAISSTFISSLEGNSTLIFSCILISKQNMWDVENVYTYFRNPRVECIWTLLPGLASHRGGKIHTHIVWPLTMFGKMGSILVNILCKFEKNVYSECSALDEIVYRC